MTTTPSVATRVFAVFELLEEIVLIACHQISAESWSIRESLAAIKLISRLQATNRRTRAIIKGSSRLQLYLQWPSELLTSCPHCGQDDNDDDAGACECPLPRHYEPIIWLLRHQLQHQVAEGHKRHDPPQDPANPMERYTLGLRSPKRTDSLILNSTDQHRSTRGPFRTFQKKRSHPRALWRNVKIPYTTIVVNLKLLFAPHLMHRNLDVVSGEEVWEFGEDATLGEVFDRYCELVSKERNLSRGRGGMELKKLFRHETIQETIRCMPLRREIARLQEEERARFEGGENRGP